jgi:hypothetical protein
MADMSLLLPVILVLLAAAAVPLLVALVQAGPLSGRSASGARPLRALTALRLAALALIGLAAVNPSWQREVRRQQRPPLVVLVDASASMGLPGEGGRTRWQQVQEALQNAAVRRELQRFEAIIAPFGPGLIFPAPDRPTAQSTDIALALQQAQARYGPQTMLVISDGAETAREDTRGHAARHRAAGGTVWTAGVGALEPPANVGPVALQAPRVAREKQPIPVRVLVRSQGYVGEQPLVLEVDGKPVARPTVALVPGGTAAVRQQLAGLAPGFHLLTAKAAPRAGEATEADNVRHQLVEVRRDETRIVLLAGAPDPDYAALRRLMARSPKTKLDSYARLGPGKFLHQRGEAVTREAPDLARLLREAHVLVLMGYPLPAAEAEAVRAFVTGGGALAWLAGKQSSGAGALGGVLPAEVGGLNTVLTPAAAPTGDGPLAQQLAQATSASWWQGAPFLGGAAGLGNVRAGAEVALRGRSGQPLLVTAAAGVGAVLIFAGTGTQRWQLSPEADDNSRRLYEAFWGVVLGWLSQPRQQGRLVVMVDPPIAPAGRPVRLIAALSGLPEAKVQAEVTGPQTKLTVPLSPGGQDRGRYVGGLSALRPGTYSVRFTATAGPTRLQETRQLVIEPGGAELWETTQQAGELQAIAVAGGGQHAPVGQLAELLSRLPTAATATPVMRRLHPFRSAAALAVIVGLLSLEWWLRRRWGW